MGNIETEKRKKKILVIFGLANNALSRFVKHKPTNHSVSRAKVPTKVVFSCGHPVEERFLQWMVFKKEFLYGRVVLHVQEEYGVHISLYPSLGFCIILYGW